MQVEPDTAVVVVLAGPQCVIVAAEQRVVGAALQHPSATTFTLMPTLPVEV